MTGTIGIKKYNRFERIMLLTELKNRFGITIHSMKNITELSIKLNVSIRTIQRDLEYMKEYTKFTEDEK